MGFLIEDGATGLTAAVNNENRLLVAAETASTVATHSLLGQSYDFSTTVINLTTAGESGIIYLKNTNPTEILQIARFAMSLGATTGGGTADAFIRLYANPTGGTLISAGTTITAGNRNFGVITPALATATQGVTGSTITGGTLVATLMTAASTRNLIDSEIVLPPGASLAVSVQPPAANTSMNVVIFLVTAYLSPDALP